MTGVQTCALPISREAEGGQRSGREDREADGGQRGGGRVERRREDREAEGRPRGREGREGQISSTCLTITAINQIVQ